MNDRAMKPLKRLRKHSRSRSGFLLLETMIGVAIFTLGVLVMGWCMENCLNAEIVRNMDQLARVALENRMSEVEGGVVVVGDEAFDEALSGRFQGITIRHSRVPVEIENEKREKLSNLFEVYLEATWNTPVGQQSKMISFYVPGA